MNLERSERMRALAVCSYIDRRYCTPGIKRYREVPVGRSIIGKDRRIDILVPALRRPYRLASPSSQKQVWGETRLRLVPIRFQVVGACSPYAMMGRAATTYREKKRLWSGAVARGFARIAAVTPLLYARANARASQSEVGPPESRQRGEW